MEMPLRRPGPAQRTDMAGDDCRRNAERAEAIGDLPCRIELAEPNAGDAAQM